MLHFLHLFALDGVAKLTVFGLHVSIPLVLSGLLLPFSLNNKSISLLKNILKTDFFLVSFVLYAVLSLLWSANPALGGRLIAQYMIPSIILYMFLVTNSEHVHNSRFWEVMLFLLIFTGYIQIFMYYLFDYQIDFAGFGRMFYDYTFTYRLRGFFQEPNWYGLFAYFSFANYWVFCKLEKKKMHPILLIGLFVVLLLSRNRAIFLILLYISIIRNVDLRKYSYIVLIFFMLLIGAALPIILKDTSGSVRAGSIIRTYNYISQGFSPINLLTGKGWGSWASISYKHKLGHVYARGDEFVGNRVVGGRADSSEYTMTFVEVGIIGLILIALDMGVLFVHCLKYENAAPNRLAFLFLFSIAGIAFFYPLYSFMPYMVSYMSLRAFVKLRYIDKAKILL